MQSESTNLEKNLLIHLECPVCLEYMRPPIILCANGHNICNICKQKMHHSPTCKEQFFDTRNKCTEDLASQVKYPCKYRSYGCTEIFNHDKTVGHQVKCRYIPQVCPVSKLAFGNWSWSGSYNDMKGYLKWGHLNNCCEYAEGGNKFLCGSTTLKCAFNFIFSYNVLFVFLLLEEDDILYAVLLYFGPAENAAEYKCKVEFVNKDDRERVTVVHLTRSSEENLHDTYRSGNCGKLLYDVANRLRDKIPKLMFKIEIHAGNA